MSGLHAADGSLNITVVSGLTYTGRYAADGSYNVVVATGLTYVGINHPCGALWVTQTTTGLKEFYAPDGSMYVSTSPYTSSGATRVTVVGGSLGANYANYFMLLLY